MSGDDELPEWDWDKIPTKEEIEAILDAKDDEPMSVEEAWMFELDRKARQERARKESSSGSP
ncbi:MAG: hypothetical protein OXQ84_12880 [bacterium]|nr:hypothetical protein [bacterium]